MYKIDPKVNILVGTNEIFEGSIKPYDTKICEFIVSISDELKKNVYNDFVDLKALSFWCRKKNIEKLKKDFLGENLRTSIGTIFHITPSNVPLNFFYSLLFGLLTGNNNIVKVPSRSFEQISIICKVINNLLKIKKFKNIKKLIKIIKYDSDFDDCTEFFSSICDARLIWGGDKSIEKIKKFPTKSRTLDLTFADRYSICLINSEKLNSINEIDLNNLIRQFFNDVFVFDQNACSSPHLILWIGKKVLRARKKFWNKLNNFVEKKYEIPEKAAYDKFSQFCLDAGKINKFKSQEKFGKNIYTVFLKKLSPNIDKFRGKWGYFYEYEIKNLNEIKSILNNKFQTMTYYGVKKDNLELFAKSNLKGLDRIVPIGQALNMSFKWDGYDINKILTRVIDLK